MKKLLLTIATGSFIIVCLSINAQEKKQHFEFKELKTEQSPNSEFDKNYKEGVRLYNLAVNQIKKETSVSVEELETLEKITSEQFKQALTCFEKAYKINSKDKIVLEALSGCYFALNDKNNFEKFQKELTAIK